MIGWTNWDEQRAVLKGAEYAGYFTVDNALLVIERLWKVVVHTLTTIAGQNGWSCADAEDFYQVAERLNAKATPM